MIDRIVMEGGLIRRERIETLSEAPIEALSSVLIRKVATTFPMLPTNPVRYMHFDPEDGRGMWLIEQPPARRHIRVWHNYESNYTDDSNRRDDNGEGVWHVQFPWQYFRFGFTIVDRNGSLVNFVLDEAALFWSRDTLRDQNHPLIPAPIPNVDDTGHICWGGTRADDSSLNARVDDYINNFTHTSFNEDLGHRTPFGTSLTEWETQSQNDNPLAWRDWPIWQNPRRTYTPLQMTTELTAQPIPPMAELNPSFINLPEPPLNFTILRARQYINSLTPAGRARFTAAIALEETPA